jgi:hypothetical protein
MGSDVALPALIRTNIGMARLEAGGYRYGCPSQFGDSERAPMAVAGAGALIVALGGGEAFGSVDGGCSFAPMDRGAAAAYYALTASSEGDGAWVLQGNVSDGEGAVARYGASGDLEELKVFAGSEGWIPDSLASWSEGERSGVLLSGATPSPRIWRGERHETADGEYWTWSSWPLNGLAVDTAHLRVTNVGESGRFWLIISDDSGRTLWHGDFDPDGPPSLSIAHAPAEILFGPVDTPEGSLALFDGELEREDLSTGAVSWVPLGDVGWTCLHELQGVVVACTLTHLLEVEAGETGAAPTTREIFQLASLQGPLTECLSEEAAQLCESDWVHYGAEAGLYAPPEVQPEPETSTSSGGGCGAARGTDSSRWPLGWMVGFVALAAWPSRRRAC